MTETENLKLTMDAPSEAYSVERVNANTQKLDDFAGAVNTALSEKQGTLTFDSRPTESSINPVTSGGVYDALALKADAAAVTIPSGADMDTYTAAGSYISMSSSTTGTLTNAPTGVSGKGFALDVIQTAANAIVQRISCMQVSTTQPRVFYRGGRNADGWTFGVWYEVTMVAEA